MRLVKKADGYYCQFLVKVDFKIDAPLTEKIVRLDVGLTRGLSPLFNNGDSNGNKIENPKFYRKAEKQLNRANRKKSSTLKTGGLGVLCEFSFFVLRCCYRH